MFGGLLSSRESPSAHIPYQMRSLLQSISQFFQRLFNFGNSYPQRSHPNSSETVRSGRPQNRPPTPETNALTQTASLRQLVYRATYGLPRQKRTHAAQIGALLREQDSTFSYEKYKFTKLIDLLEAVPDLVEMEKVDPAPGNPNSAPVYYVRPVTNTKRLLLDTLNSYNSADGWVHLDSLKAAIAQLDPAFSSQKYGFTDFKAFLESRADLIEFKIDSPSYVRLVPASTTSAPPRRIIAQPRRAPIKKPRSESPNGKAGAARPLSRPTSYSIEPLSKFAGFSPETLNQKVSELAAIALPENWYFGPQPPADFTYPICKSYLRYTFIRLQHEGKVIASPDHKYRAFNAGLLDTLLRPIYGLLTRPSSGLPDRQWGLDFCIAGQGYAGKMLVAQFAQLPIAANYLDNADQAFYRLASGAPQVDWQHVVQDNMARLPLDFLVQYAPAGFTPRSTQGLTTPEFFDYKRSFVEALEADPAGYRKIVNKLEEALDRTLRRIQINYKTAVPTYYPKINSIDLLLPMCLADENTTDLALVVRREPSDKYIGHTILTMRQAYNNARLICKLDEHWLTRSMALSQEEFDEDDDDESEEFVPAGDKESPRENTVGAGL